MASNGDLASAASYYYWKRYTVIFSIVSLFLGLNGGPFGGFMGIFVAVYYAMVVRSHYVSLLKDAHANASALSSPQV